MFWPLHFLNNWGKNRYNLLCLLEWYIILCSLLCQLFDAHESLGLFYQNLKASLFIIPIEEITRTPNCTCLNSAMHGHFQVYQNHNHGLTLVEKNHGTRDRHYSNYRTHYASPQTAIESRLTACHARCYPFDHWERIINCLGSYWNTFLYQMYILGKYYLNCYRSRKFN